MDHITCHILDTTIGKPASGVTCQLYYISPIIGDADDESLYSNNNDQPFAMGKTDGDGRIKKWNFNPSADLSQLGINNMQWETLKPGVYKVKFLTGKYFWLNKSKTFFPFVEILFNIESDEHYHIPLLLSNHSYSTYRGS